MTLTFRTIRNSDLEMIMHWRMQPDVTRYMYSDPELTLTDQINWFQDISTDPGKTYWIINVDHKDVGLVGLYHIDMTHRRCEWGYYLASTDMRGKGIGKSVELNVLRYVFETLGLNKLCCQVFAWNTLVIDIHKKYGAVIEGTRRGHIYKNGTYEDIVEMGTLKQDWEKHIKDKIEYVVALIE